MTLVRFDTNANLQWVTLPARDGGWIGVCEPLKITVQGETFGELLQNANGVLNDLLVDLMEDGELDRFLHDHGWRPISPVPHGVDAHDIQFEVPFDVRVGNAHAA